MKTTNVCRTLSACFVALLKLKASSSTTTTHFRRRESDGLDFALADGGQADRVIRRSLSFLSAYSDPLTEHNKAQELQGTPIGLSAVDQQEQEQEGRIVPREAFGENDNLPYCSLDGPNARHSMKGGKWVDTHTSEITRPMSDHLMDVFKKELEEDLFDRVRKERVARLWYEPIKCRLHDWDSDTCKQCLSGRRLIFVGDSLTMQMTGAFLQLLDERFKFTQYDSPEDNNLHRYQIDPLDPDGPSIYGRSMFASKDSFDVDSHPIKFSVESWDAMVAGLGGWQHGDVLVVNFGAHYLSSQDGVERMRRDFETLFRTTLANIPKDDVTVFWREYAPAHFAKTHDGEYPADKRVEVPSWWHRFCGPHRINEPSVVNEIASSILQECGAECEHIRRIEIWDMMKGAWDQHAEASHKDCRHFLSPGPMDVWNNLLFHQLCFIS